MMGAAAGDSHDVTQSVHPCADMGAAGSELHMEAGGAGSSQQHAGGLGGEQLWSAGPASGPWYDECGLLGSSPGCVDSDWAEPQQEQEQQQQEGGQPWQGASEEQQQWHGGDGCEWGQRTGVVDQGTAAEDVDWLF